MKAEEFFSLNDERVAPFTSLTEAQLRNRLNPAEAVFIAESPKVIDVALRAGYEPVSFLCEKRHIEGDARELLERCPNTPVFTGSRELLAKLTGYTLTRGVLCAMRRPAEKTVEEITCGAKRIVVIDSVVDTTNIGSIFRAAAALGIDAVLLTRSSCDPLNRRSVRVSMGSVFLVPWGWIDNSTSAVKALGFKTAAMALRKDSVSLSDPVLKAEPRLALVMGTEGDGLSDHAIEGADYVVMIPMKNGVDSLNVASAAAVAFWELGKSEI